MTCSISFYVILLTTAFFLQVTRIFCYLTVVTLQYLIPIFLILFSTLALKALGTALHSLMLLCILKNID